MDLHGEEELRPSSAADSEGYGVGKAKTPMSTDPFARDV